MPYLPRPTKQPAPNWQNRASKPDAFLQGKAWKRFRYMHLERQPLCEACLPERLTDCRAKGAGQIDHIVSRETGGALLDIENVMTLCRSHHARKSALERHGLQIATQNKDGESIPAPGEKERILKLIK